MLQYLINTTAIWLISLVMFELFLRRESYHNYNRFYILATFLLGALMPLWQWQDSLPAREGTLQQPIEKVITAKQSIIAATAASGTIDWQKWLLIVYIIGALVALCILLADTVKLVVLYRTGKKQKQNGWLVIETGRGHAPFSFLNMLFINSRQQYTDEEWRIILVHEQRHKKLLHFADLLLMQLGRIIFWFHPLVYIYNKRLLLVHEYQADSAAATQPRAYGSFLIEQALLGTAPTLSHSFNRSPIKKRIVMLTRRSSALAKSKMLVFIPLAIVCVVCFSKNTFSQRFERKGNKVTYKGNTFEMSEKTFDTVFLIDPVTGKEQMKIAVTEPRPTSMNGNPLLKNVNQAPAYTGGEKDLRQYLLINLRDELSKLNDGQYTLDISDIIVDENGKIVYFDYHDMRRSRTQDEIKQASQSGAPVMSTTSNPPVNVTIGDKTMLLRRNNNSANYEQINKDNQQEIYDKVCRLMETAPGFIPGKNEGKNVPSFYICPRFWNHFKVKDHKLYDVDLHGEYKEL